MHIRKFHNVSERRVILFPLLFSNASSYYFLLAWMSRTVKVSDIVRETLRQQTHFHSSVWKTCYYQLDRLTQDELVDLPVLEVLLEDEGAHVGVEVEHAGAVDVQDGVEAVPVPVEEELCLYQVTSSNTAMLYPR